MTKVIVLEELVADYSNELDIKNYMESTFSMFSGITERVQMRFENKFVNAVLDRFGFETKLRKDYEKHFSVTVNIKTEHTEPFFAWLFKFNGAAEIIEPISLRKKYCDMLRHNMENAI